MCDYSLTNVQARDAIVGDKLVVRDFGTGTRGFAPADGIGREAVCLRPGTEIAFVKEIECYGAGGMLPWLRNNKTEHKVAIFRQINRDKVSVHHDALELPDGKVMLLTLLAEGQHATVLQLPAMPKTEAEAREQERVVSAG